jgi:hypothetical protein
MMPAAPSMAQRQWKISACTILHQHNKHPCQPTRAPADKRVGCVGAHKQEGAIKIDVAGRCLSHQDTTAAGAL